MGLFGKKLKDPVTGTARIISTSIAPRATHGNCHMQLVIEAPGMEPTLIKHHAWVVPTDRWPDPGQVIPVTVDRTDPEKIDIDWDEVPSSSEQAAAQAEALAAHLRGDAGAGAAAMPVDPATGGLVDQLQQMFPDAHIEVQGGTAADLPPGMIGQMEQALGMDLDGDGRIGATPSAPPAGEQGDDRIARLERLAALHQAGALSDEEFAAEKRRILTS